MALPTRRCRPQAAPTRTPSAAEVGRMSTPTCPNCGAERFWLKVARRGPDECWLWTGAVTRRGYGEFRNKQASRVAWALTVGPIGDGLEIAHICGLRRCVNPDHLAALTHLQAQLRSPISFASINAAKTKCPRGHSYDHTAANGWRRCRACGRNRRRATNSELLQRRRGEKVGSHGPRPLHSTIPAI